MCGTSKQNINKYHDLLGRWQMNNLCISWKQISTGFPLSAAKCPHILTHKRRSVIPVIGKTKSGRLLGFLFSAIWTECQQIVHMEKLEKRTRIPKDFPFRQQQPAQVGPVHICSCPPPIESKHNRIERDFPTSLAGQFESGMNFRKFLPQ